jgi:DUF1365 family protein
MLTQARLLGYVFNPLTVYWCHDADGALRHPLAPLRAALAIRFRGIRLYLRRLPVVPRPCHEPKEGMK